MVHTNDGEFLLAEEEAGSCRRMCKTRIKEGMEL